MCFITLPTNLLQIYLKIIFKFKVIVLSIIGPDEKIQDERLEINAVDRLNWQIRYDILVVMTYIVTNFCSLRSTPLTKMVQFIHVLFLEDK